MAKKAQTEATGSGSTPKSKQKPAARQKTVLVVDDYEPLRKSLAKAFSSLGIQVIEAGDGAEALSILKYNDNIDLVMLDLYMPKMDGMTVAERLRDKEEKGGRAVPIIFLTSESQKSKVAQAKMAGIKAWIIKPPQMSVLKAIQEQYLNPTI